MGMIKCPSCGKSILDSSKRCLYCGRMMENKDIGATEAVVASKQFDEQAESAQPVAELNDKTKKYVRRLHSSIIWVALAIHIVLVVMFLVGAPAAYGRSTGAYGTVKSIISLFSIKRGKIFKTLLRCGLAGIYIYAIVKIVKNSISLGKGINEHIKKRKVDIDKAVEMHRTIYKTAVNTVMSIMMYMIMYVAFAGGDSNWAVYWSVALTIALYVACSALECVGNELGKLKSKQNVADFVFSLIRPALTAVLLTLISVYLIRPGIYEFAFGIQNVFGGYFGAGFFGVCETLYYSLIKNALDVAVAFMFYFMLSKVMLSLIDELDKKYGDWVSKDIRKSFINIIEVEAVSIGLFVVLTIADYGSDFGAACIGTLYNVLRIQHLPAMLLLLGGIFTVYLFNDAKQSRANGVAITQKA